MYDLPSIARIAVHGEFTAEHYPNVTQPPYDMKLHTWGNTGFEVRERDIVLPHTGWYSFKAMQLMSSEGVKDAYLHLVLNGITQVHAWMHHDQPADAILVDTFFAEAGSVVKVMLASNGAVMWPSRHNKWSILFEGP